MRKLNDVMKRNLTVVLDRPPIFEKIADVLPQARKTGVIFTYGDKVYNPSRVSLTPELTAHEATHVAQQIEMGADVWWDRYLADPQFRYEQELEAHRVELEAYSVFNNRHARRAAEKLIARRLAGPLYGNASTEAKARKDLKHVA